MKKVLRALVRDVPGKQLLEAVQARPDATWVQEWWWRSRCNRYELSHDSKGAGNAPVPSLKIKPDLAPNDHSLLGMTIWSQILCDCHGS